MKNIYRLLLASVMLSSFNLNAIEYSRTVTVTPQTINKKYTITNRAKKGDTLKINFITTKDYKLISSKVKDSEKIGWKEDLGDHKFKVTLDKDFARGKAHSAKFSGILEDNKKTAGGKKESSSKSKKYPWDLKGLFRVLGECEGVGDDLNRNPKAGLVSKKQIKGNPILNKGN